jgi:hypothetical protein
MKTKHTSNGRWIPSKMLPIIPGPSSTERGMPELNTGSPTVNPALKSWKGRREKRKVIIDLDAFFFLWHEKVFLW